MDCWQETQIAPLLNASNVDELFAALVPIARELGFDHCAYGIRTPLPVSNPKVLMLNNYPQQWQQRYQRENYLACDPTVSHALRSTASQVWTEDIFSSARPFWEEARAHGLRVGIAQPCHGNHGVVGLLTLSRPHDALSQPELRNNSMRIYWLAQLVHEGMSRIILPQMLPETSINLSDREVEVLRWTADGKTSHEVSEIMKISERTVNFHVNNVMEKLGTRNKTAAAVKAAILGLI